MSGQVFRHFGDEAALRTYAKGAWQGSGVQAANLVHPDIRSNLTVIFRRSASVDFSAYGTLSRGVPGGLPGMQKSFREKHSLNSRAQVLADLAVLEADGCRFEFQALDDRRAYATVKTSAGLVFAGALKRSRFRSFLVALGII